MRDLNVLRERLSAIDPSVRITCYEDEKTYLIYVRNHEAHVTLGDWGWEIYPYEERDSTYIEEMMKQAFSDCEIFSHQKLIHTGSDRKQLLNILLENNCEIFMDYNTKCFCHIEFLKEEAKEMVSYGRYFRFHSEWKLEKSQKPKALMLLRVSNDREEIPPEEREKQIHIYSVAEWEKIINTLINSLKQIGEACLQFHKTTKTWATHRPQLASFADLWDIEFEDCEGFYISNDAILNDGKAIATVDVLPTDARRDTYSFKIWMNDGEKTAKNVLESVREFRKGIKKTRFRNRLKDS